MIELQAGNKEGNKLRFRTEIRGNSAEAYFVTDSGRTSPDVMLPFVLLAAMREGSSVHVHGSLSSTVRENFMKTVAVFCRWFPDNFKPIQITADELTQDPTTPSPRARVGAFFTGGVDSWYTLLKNRDEIDDLIYVDGYDGPLDDTTIRTSTSQHLRSIADKMDLRLVEIETDARPLLRRHGRWGLHGHGLALGGIARLLANNYRKIYIPSSFHYDDLAPWGSHPEIDPFYGDAMLEVIHDGCEAHRTDKIVRISQFPIAVQNIRVCGDRTHRINCGECEKCVRTMTTLHALGLHNLTPAFGRNLSKNLILRQVLDDESVRKFAIDNISLLDRTPGNDHFSAAWKSVLERSSFENKIRRKLLKIDKKVRSALKA